MIVCDKYGFVFLKTRKTAGTSIEIALSRLCGPGDIVTKVAQDDEKIRAEEGGYGPAGQEKRLRHYSLREWRKRIKYGERATGFANHAGADMAKTLVSSRFWDGCYKFTSERNPWDKAVSRYYWQKSRWEGRKRKTVFPPLNEYLAYLEAERPHWLSCWAIYTINDQVVVDDVIFYEDLHGSLERVAARLGVAGNLVLPRKRAKARRGQQRQDYRQHFDEASYDIVARVCHKEIAAFGYRFDGGKQPSLACSA